MFCELVDVLLRYNEDRSCPTLNLVDSIRSGIKRDLQLAYDSSAKLIESNQDLYERSRTFFDFLLRVADIAFVGQRSDAPGDLVRRHRRGLSDGDGELIRKLRVEISSLQEKLRDCEADLARERRQEVAVLSESDVLQRDTKSVTEELNRHPDRSSKDDLAESCDSQTFCKLLANSPNDNDPVNEPRNEIRSMDAQIDGSTLQSRFQTCQSELLQAKQENQNLNSQIENLRSRMDDKMEVNTVCDLQQQTSEYTSQNNALTSTENALRTELELLKLQYRICLNAVEHLTQKNAEVTVRISSLQNFKTQVIVIFRWILSYMRKSFDTEISIMDDQEECALITSFQAVANFVGDVVNAKKNENENRLNYCKEQIYSALLNVQETNRDWLVELGFQVVQGDLSSALQNDTLDSFITKTVMTPALKVMEQQKKQNQQFITEINNLTANINNLKLERENFVKKLYDSVVRDPNEMIPGSNWEDKLIYRTRDLVNFREKCTSLFESIQLEVLKFNVNYSKVDLENSDKDEVLIRKFETITFQVQLLKSVHSEDLKSKENKHVKTVFKILVYLQERIESTFLIDTTRVQLSQVRRAMSETDSESTPERNLESLVDKLIANLSPISKEVRVLKVNFERIRNILAQPDIDVDDVPSAVEKLVKEQLESKTSTEEQKQILVDCTVAGVGSEDEVGIGARRKTTTPGHQRQGGKFASEFARLVCKQYFTDQYKYFSKKLDVRYLETKIAQLNSLRKDLSKKSKGPLMSEHQMVMHFVMSQLLTVSSVITDIDCEKFETEMDKIYPTRSTLSQNQKLEITRVITEAVTYVSRLGRKRCTPTDGEREIDSTATKRREKETPPPDTGDYYVGSKDSTFATMEEEDVEDSNVSSTT